MALRTGAVGSKSLEDLMLATRSRRNRTILWTQGKWPVISQMHPQGSGLALDKPANTGRITLTLAQGGRQAGFVDSLVGHDLRRGAAKDLKVVKRKITEVGLPDQEIGATLGHDRVTFNDGVTDKYIGPNGKEYWSRRLEDAVGEAFELPTSLVPYKRRRASKEEVTSRCNQMSLDSTNKRSRRKATERIAQEELEEWTKKAKESAWSLDESSGSTSHSNLPGPVPSISDEDVLARQEREDKEDENSDDIPIDPELLALGQTMNSLITGSDAPSQDAERLLMDPLPSATSLTSAEDNHGTFIERFSTLNIVSSARFRHQAPSREDPLAHLFFGNSKDEPTSFRHSCPYASQGCDYVTGDKTYLFNHHVPKTCHFSPQYIAPAPKDFPCEYQGCNSGFKHKAHLKRHIKNVHAWVPCNCGGDGPNCDPAMLYDSYADLRRHKEEFHRSQGLRKCPVQSCHSTFKREDYLRNHVRACHPTEDMEVLIPRMRPIGKSKPVRCPEPRCESDRMFKNRPELRLHLQHAIHGLTPDEIDAYVSSAW